MTNWKVYFNKHKSRRPADQLLRAISFCVSKDRALDLGAGNLIESQALIDAGFKEVVAVDSAPEVRDFADELNNPKLIINNIGFREYDFPKDTFDLANAEFALPFYGKEGFKEFINNIKNSLKEGGVFTGQFFGVNDGWNTPNESNIVFQTREESLDLLDGLEILEFKEEEKESGTAAGQQKHWHIFRFICKKSQLVIA